MLTFIPFQDVAFQRVSTEQDKSTKSFVSRSDGESTRDSIRLGKVLDLQDS